MTLKPCHNNYNYNFNYEWDWYVTIIPKRHQILKFIKFRIYKWCIYKFYYLTSRLWRGTVTANQRVYFPKGSIKVNHSISSDHQDQPRTCYYIDFIPHLNLKPCI